MRERRENDEQRFAVIASLRQRAAAAAAEWTPAQCRARGAVLLAAAAASAALNPLWWRGTRLEWFTTFWPLAVVMFWVWLALSFYRYN